MTLRGLTTASSKWRPATIIRLNPARPSISPTLYHSHLWPSIPKWTRGAKTKTTLKASSLPQGPLPPLPSISSDPKPKPYSPVLQGHLDAVRQFPDCVVLTRVGDFYEMYFDQVEQYAPLVNLKRAKKGDVPMAGLPYHQLDRYLKMFVMDLGKNVAIAEQIPLSESERLAGRGSAMFTRRVTRVVTAGTLIDEAFVDPLGDNYLLAVHLNPEDFMAWPVEGPGREEAFERFKRTAGVGLSWIDLSTGSFFTQAGKLDALSSLVARIGPKEVVLPQGTGMINQADLQRLLGDGEFSIHIHTSTKDMHSIDDWTSMLEKEVLASERGAFTEEEIGAGSLALDYIRTKLFDTKLQLQPPVRRSEHEYMSIDKQSLRGLEVRSTLHDNNFKGSLLHAVRNTVTKSGARLLSQRLVSPSMNISVINSRLDLVQELVLWDSLREDVVSLLRRTADIVRLVQKFSIGRGDADELLALARTIDVMKQMATLLQSHIHRQQELSRENPEAPTTDLSSLQDIINRLDLDGPTKLAKSIQTTIDEESLNRKHAVEDEAQAEAEELTSEVLAADAAGLKPPKRTRPKPTKEKDELRSDEIWIMKATSSPTLQRAHAQLEDLMTHKRDLTESLRAKLQTTALDLKWSASLAHYCHLRSKPRETTTHATALASLPGITPAATSRSSRSFHYTPWTTLGLQLDQAKLRIRLEEDAVFTKLRKAVITNLPRLRRNASVLDELDVAASSATHAKTANLVRPLLTSTPTTHILAGRHPTVDASLLASGRPFTPNDCHLGLPSPETPSGPPKHLYLLTGPNMAGKSTYLRQIALLTLLAQASHFVPARYAAIGLTDAIYSRIGSADSLATAQSTFMLEMQECASILHRATPRSLVLMDEVGRGTTSEAGLAVSFAVVDYLYHEIGCRTVFATHFHRVVDMCDGWEGVEMLCSDVEAVEGGGWVYVHKLRRGVNRRSHALKVARLAGVPERCVRVAERVLGELGEGGEGEGARGEGHGGGGEARGVFGG